MKSKKNRIGEKLFHNSVSHPMDSTAALAQTRDLPGLQHASPLGTSIDRILLTPVENLSLSFTSATATLGHAPHGKPVRRGPAMLGRNRTGQLTG
jgi:hypothetical protein